MSNGDCSFESWDLPKNLGIKMVQLVVVSNMTLTQTQTNMHTPTHPHAKHQRGAIGCPQIKNQIKVSIADETFDFHVFFSNKTWRPSPISIPPFKTTQTQLQPHWFTNNFFFLDLFGTPSYTPQCNCMEKCLTNQCPKHAATCQLTRPLWFSVEVVMLIPWMDA